MRKSPFPYKGVVGQRRGVLSFFATVIIGAAGAISSQDKSEATGMAQIVKTAAQVGRYTITLPERYKTFLKGVVTIIGPNSAAYNGAANTSGLMVIFRADDIDANNKDGTIELQFVQASTYSDAELPNPTTFIVEIVVSEGV